MNWTKKFKSMNALIVSFILAGVLIGVLLVAQFKSSVAANSYLVDEINAQKDLLDSFDEDREQLSSNINSLRGKLDIARQNIQKIEGGSTLEELDKLKGKLGLTKIKGEGVRIIMAEGNGKAEGNANLIHAADLRDLVNVLGTAKIQGVAVNGQRIVSNSTINALGSLIMVNKVKLAAPFEINIVGDITLITDRLADERAYPDLFKRIKNKDIKFELEKLSQVVLPAYEGDFTYKNIENK